MPDATAIADSIVDHATGVQPRAERGPRVLFVQHCANMSGSTVSGRLSASAFVQAGWDVDAVFGYDGPAIASYESAGCRTQIIEHRNWLRDGKALQSTRKMLTEVRGSRRFLEIMRTTRPDVVYVNSLVSLAAAVAAKRLSIPVVWHIRELFDDVGGEMHAPALGGKPLVRRTLRGLADRLVAISESVAENVIGPRNRDKTDVVFNAVSDEFFEPPSQAESRGRLVLPQDKLIVGVPGTLRPMKGHPFFLDAAALLAEAAPDCLFAISGDGEARYRGELTAQVEKNGLQSRVVWLGMVNDMRSFYAACDVVCVPSRAEPFGRTVIEAFAAARPVVASAVGGIRETIEDGVTGLLVPYGDTGRLADALQSLLTSESLRRRLGNEARKTAMAKYHASIYQARIVELATSVIRAAK